MDGKLKDEVKYEEKKRYIQDAGIPGEKVALRGGGNVASSPGGTWETFFYH